MGHKDYLWQKRLSRALPLDTFRFDFRGNHESGGSWNFAGFPNEVADLDAVVRHLDTVLGYRVVLLVAHSRGSLVCFRWLCTAEAKYVQRVQAFVNISARYRMQKIYDRAGFSDGDERDPRTGDFIWRTTTARKPRVERVTNADIAAFASWNTARVRTDFPSHVDVLTIHGKADDLVSPVDAELYDDDLRHRSPGKHTLYLVEGANHTYDNDREEVIRAVIGWWAVREQGLISNTRWTRTPEVGQPEKAKL
ncbi:alpha/beta-hydrolase [Auricularia subglabra TFB-10046 SS5]|nr:alpha/beta-hydrolase [Auricularia subglabra TFB-10046 SS5]